MNKIKRVDTSKCKTLETETRKREDDTNPNHTTREGAGKSAEGS
jgi:hypothetical protein